MSVTWVSGNSGASGNFGSGGTASGAVVAAESASGGHCPNLPLSFCRWGNLVPIHTFLPLVLPLNWWLVVPGPGALSLWGVWNSSSSCIVIIIIRRDWPVFSQFKKVPRHFSCFRPWGAIVDWDVFKGWGIIL